jgi:hypothetical protein
MSQTKAQLIDNLVQALNFTGTASAPANGAFLSATNTLALATNSAQRLTIDSSGNVGINQNTPTCQLQVDAGSSGSGTSTALELNHKGNDLNDAIKLNFARAGGDIGSIVLEKVNNNNTTDFIFNTRASNTVSESMRITGAGFLGIGTTSPLAPLHVYNATNNTISRLESGDATSRLQLKDNSGEAFVGATGDDLIFSNTSSITERMRIDSSGRVGLGISNPDAYFSSFNRVVLGRTNDTGGMTIVSGSTSGGYIAFADGTSGNAAYRGQIAYYHNVDALAFATDGGTERLRIDSSGRLLVGHSSARQIAGGNSKIQVESNDSTGRISIVQNRNEASGAPFLSLGKSRGTSVGSSTVVQSGDTVGTVAFAGADGTDFPSVAQIVGQVDGTPGNNDMPGRLCFHTTADGSDSPTERMRIDSQGRVKIHGVGATISNHALGTTHTPLYLQTVTDLTAVNTAEGSASTGLFRMFDVSTSSDRYHGIELRNKNNGDIRILNQDRNTSDKGDLVIVMPKSDGVASGLSEKIRISGLYDSVNIAGKGGATLKGPSDSGYNIQKTDVYIATKTEVTAVGTQAGDAVAGLIRFEDTGSSNNRFHGIELRNKNSGDIRILNKDVGASNKADMVFATDNGSDVTEVARFLNSGGLTFGGSTSSEHALKDYEEGTFTPGLAFSGGSTGVAYSSRSASFIKIGTMVYCQIQMDLTSKGSSTGNAEITGLPFTVGNYVSGTGQEGTGFITWWANYSSSNSETVFWVNEGNTVAQIYNAKPATNISQQTESSWENNTQMRAFVIFRST